MSKSSCLTIAILLGLSACGRAGAPPGAPEKVGIDAEGRPLRLGEASAVSGTPFLTLKIGESESGSYSSYSGGNDRNVMILDPRDGSSRKILQTNDRQLAQWLVLEDGVSPNVERGYPPDSSDKSVSTHYVAVVQADANRGDKAGQGYDVLLGSFADGRQVWIAKDADGLIHAQKLQSGSVVMIVADRGRTFVRYFAPDSLALQRSTELKV